MMLIHHIYRPISYMFQIEKTILKTILQHWSITEGFNITELHSYRYSDIVWSM